MNKKQKIDKETFKQIFRDHFEEFQKQNPRYNNDYYDEVIEKMINCAEEDSGYAKYFCMHCFSIRLKYTRGDSGKPVRPAVKQKINP